MPQKNEARTLSGFLLLADDSNMAVRLHFLMSELLLPLVQRLINHAYPGERFALRVLGRATVDILPMKDDDHVPFERIGTFIQPRIFTGDKSGDFWCLLTKSEASQLHREWREDPRYDEDKGQTNYFKNQVDMFEHQMKERQW